MRIIFAGTPSLAIPTLAALIEAGHEIVAVLTREDAPVGRKRVLTPSPVAQFAHQHNLKVINANRLTSVNASELAQYNAQLGVVVAYGVILSQEILDIPAQGWINLHFSELPAYRGAAPAQRAILNQEITTASTVFKLVAELDAGDIFDVEKTEIFKDETSGELLDRLAVSGARQVVRVVEDLERGNAVAYPQKGQPTFAPKISSEDARLNLNMSRESVYARFRAVTPEPGAYVFVGDMRLKVLAAHLGSEEAVSPGVITIVGKNVVMGTDSGALILETVQPAGKLRMSAVDWFRGLQRGSVEVL